MQNGREFMEVVDIYRGSWCSLYGRFILECIQ